jgi:di/tricarboxylate transporter
VRLSRQTGANPVIPAIAAFLCLAALAITLWQFLSVPATVVQAAAIGGIVVAALCIEGLARWVEARDPTPGAR